MALGRALDSDAMLAQLDHGRRMGLCHRLRLGRARAADYPRWFHHHKQHRSHPEISGNAPSVSHSQRLGGRHL